MLVYTMYDEFKFLQVVNVKTKNYVYIGWNSITFFPFSRILFTTFFSPEKYKFQLSINPFLGGGSYIKKQQPCSIGRRGGFCCTLLFRIWNTTTKSILFSGCNCPYVSLHFFFFFRKLWISLFKEKQSFTMHKLAN